MSGRGRGRGGRGSGTSFNKDQLNAIGIGSGEVLPGPVTQPPPLFPPLNRKPVPITSSVELDYLLILKQDYIDYMQFSTAYLKLPQNKCEPVQEIDKLIAQLPSAKEKYDWSLFPSELRPKVLSRRAKKKAAKEVDVQSRLTELEKLETKSTEAANTTIKSEVEKGDADEDEVFSEEEEDEEMDDGTDYVNNYFDNGEALEEEDDNLDDGPIY